MYQWGLLCLRQWPPHGLAMPLPLTLVLHASNQTTSFGLLVRTACFWVSNLLFPALDIFYFILFYLLIFLKHFWYMGANEHYAGFLPRNDIHPWWGVSDWQWQCKLYHLPFCLFIPSPSPSPSPSHLFTLAPMGTSFDVEKISMVKSMQKR